MAKRKFYVVWKGVEPGVYDNWTDCQLQIKGFPGAQYASFKTREEAESAYESGNMPSSSIKTRKSTTRGGRQNWGNEVDTQAWAVDAACSGNPGVMEYRGVHVDDGSEIFRQGPFPVGTNNIGEFLAIVHALALLKKVGDDKRNIYTDSRTALSWVRKKKVKTNLKKDNSTKVLYALIARAENWLRANEYSNTLIKWDTERWGEIPADFGRK
ncbi:MAG: ribonuclease H family protein [Saprospiraceae bacterium]|nr:ribonuclease H family protein [Saprospiraceae bacterium]